MPTRPTSRFRNNGRTQNGLGPIATLRQRAQELRRRQGPEVNLGGPVPQPLPGLRQNQADLARQSIGPVQTTGGFPVRDTIVEAGGRQYFGQFGVNGPGAPVQGGLRRGTPQAFGRQVNPRAGRPVVDTSRFNPGGFGNPVRRSPNTRQIGSPRSRLRAPAGARIISRGFGST